MTQPFIHPDFLLECEEAAQLYHEHAAALPIIDFHCHLPPAEVATNKSWQNISQVWMDGDHYKWRAMRANGIHERYCTGDATDLEKFDAFAATMPYLLRNPLFHWSHLELAMYFGVDDVVLSPKTADEVWERTSAVFRQGLSVNDLLRRNKVEVICTTDAPADSLEHHRAVAADPEAPATMLPTWRPDPYLNLSDTAEYLAHLEALAQAADCEIITLDDLFTALRKRQEVFHQLGCRLSDRGLDQFTFTDVAQATAQALFARLRKGVALNPEEQCKLRSCILLELGRMDAEKGWTMQMHMGVIRFTNTRMAGVLGHDSIDDRSYARPLAHFLDRLDREGSLPKTILYNLNPSDNEMIATMTGNFQDGLTAGKIQMGSGWWFLDQKNGMERQLEALSQLGLLRRFVGMVTDSRSFLSYARHDHFRRVLCNLIGREIKQGLIPRDFSLLGDLVADICYHNASRHFGFQSKPAACHERP